MSILARLKPSSPLTTTIVTNSPSLGPQHGDNQSPSFLTSPAPPAADGTPPPPPPPKDPHLLDPTFRLRPSTSPANSPISTSGYSFYFPTPTTPLSGSNGLPASPRPSTAATGVQRDRDRERDKEKEGVFGMQFNISSAMSSLTRLGNSSGHVDSQSQSLSPASTATAGSGSTASPASHAQTIALQRQHANSPSSSSFEADETGSTLASIPSSSNSSSYPPAIGVHMLNGTGASNTDVSQLPINVSLSSADGTVRSFEKVSGGRTDGPSVTFAITPPARKDSLSFRQALKGKARTPGERFKISAALGSLTKRAGALAPVRRNTTSSPGTGTNSRTSSEQEGETSGYAPSVIAGNASPPPGAPFAHLGPSPTPPLPQTAPAGISAFKAFWRPHTASSSATVSAFPSSPPTRGSPVVGEIYPPEPSDGDPSISLPFQISHNIHVDEGFSGLPPTWTTMLPEAGFSEAEIAMMRAKGRTGPVDPKTLPGRELPKMGGLYGAVVLPDKSRDTDEEMGHLEDRMNAGVATLRAQGGGMGIGLGQMSQSPSSNSAPSSGSQVTLDATAPLVPRRAPSPLPLNGFGAERRTATPPRRPPPAGPLPAPPPKEPDPSRVRVLPEPPVRLLPTPPGPGEWSDDLGTPSEERRDLELDDLTVYPTAGGREEVQEVEYSRDRGLRTGELVDQARMVRELELEEMKTPALNAQLPSQQQQQQQRGLSIDQGSSSQHDSSQSHGHGLSPTLDAPLRASVVPPLPPVISLPQIPLSLGLGLPSSEISWGDDWAGDIFERLETTEISPNPAVSAPTQSKAQRLPPLTTSGPGIALPSEQARREQKATKTPIDDRAKSARAVPQERAKWESEKEGEDEVKQLAEMAPWLLAQMPSNASPPGAQLSHSPSSPPPPVPEKDLLIVPQVEIQPPTAAVSPVSATGGETPVQRTPIAIIPPALVLSPTSAQAQLPTIKEIQVRHMQPVPPSPPHSLLETDAGFLSDRSDSGFSVTASVLSHQGSKRTLAGASKEGDVPPVPPLPSMPKVENAKVEDDAEGQVLTLPLSPNPSITAALGSPPMRTPDADDEFDPSAYAEMSGPAFGQEIPTTISTTPSPVIITTAISSPGTAHSVTTSPSPHTPSPVLQSPILQSPIVQQLQERTPSPRSPAIERPLPPAPAQLLLPMTPPRAFPTTSPESQTSAALPSSAMFPSHIVTSPTMTPNSANGYPLLPSSPGTSDGGYMFTLAPGGDLPSRTNSVQASPGGAAVRFPQTPMDVRDRFPRSPGGETQIGDEMEDDLVDTPPSAEPREVVITNGSGDEVEEGSLGDALQDWLEDEDGGEAEDDEEQNHVPLPEGYRPLEPYLLSGSPPSPKTLTLIALGTHSHIYTASPMSPMHSETQHLAFKFIPRPTLSTLRETLLQLSLRHAHLLGADGAWLRPQSPIEGMEGEEAVQEPIMRGWEMWVRMERMERSLAEVCVLSGEGLQLGGEAVVARLMADVLEALKYLHSRGVVHRDVRSDNLLFSNDGRLLLADFFHAVQLSPERPTRKEVVGVWYWMAPELRAGQPYNTAVDIYSLGATLWELLEGVPPHSEIEDVDFLRTICHLPPLSQPLRWSEQLRSFLALCAEEPSRRPSAVALLDHPFIRRACPRSEVVALLNRARVLEDELHRQEAGATI